MNNLIDILHIYSGTSGNAGLYLDEIYKSLRNNYNQQVIVSAYYPFNYGKKIFYKYSDLGNNLRYRFKGKLRHYIRFFELCFSCIYIYFFLLFNKVKVINYSLITNIFVERWLLFFIKKTFRIKLLITCHDVLPFATYSSFEKELIKKSKFFDLADALIVHNENSILDLKKFYRIDKQKIIKFPFPVMDLTHFLSSKPENVNSAGNELITFGFVGHLRKEKGIAILIEAWEIFFSKEKKVELIIAANVPRTISFDFKEIKKKNLTLIEKYVSDNEYIEILSKCDFLILPYKRGTNSGIPSSALTVNTLVITSDIPLFNNMPYILDCLKFNSENVDSLVKVLEFARGLEKEVRNGLINESKILLKEFRKEFNKQITLVFNRLL